MQFLQFNENSKWHFHGKGVTSFLSFDSVAHGWTTSRGPQYEARLERSAACVRRRESERECRNKMKKKKKTKAALKRKVGARIETQFDPRYEAPAEVGSPRAHLTWMRWQALSNMFSCTRALAPSLIACIMRFPRARGAFLDFPSFLTAYFQRETHSTFLKLDIDYNTFRDTIRNESTPSNRVLSKRHTMLNKNL